MDFAISLFFNILISLIGFLLVRQWVPLFSQAFGTADLRGTDVNRHGFRLLPEGLGVIAVATYIICMVFFIPFVYINERTTSDFIFAFLSLEGKFLLDQVPLDKSARFFEFEPKDLIQYLGLLLSICFMALTGFADDVLRLKRRQKFFFPAIASLPLLMVYYTNIGSTDVEVSQGNPVHFGIFYYIYVIFLIVFLTNSITILSGINGIEVGQCVVISLSIIVLSFLELVKPGPCVSHYRFSLFFMIPFAATSLGLLRYDWYPARVFVGDTYCYVAGMTFAGVAVLGHYTNMLLLLFLPQIFNFIYSLPQLLGILPWEQRHRLPKFVANSGLIDMSLVKMKLPHGQTKIPEVLLVLKALHLVHVELRDIGSEKMVIFNNLTLNNFLLKVLGPMEENRLAALLLFIQTLCSLIVLFFLYDVNPLANSVCRAPWLRKT